MAASTTPPSTDRRQAVVEPCVVAVAYSGGRDSTALLHAVAQLAACGEWGQGAKVLALHVHHGLSAWADDWWAHTQAQCDGWAKQGVPVAWHGFRLQGKPGPGESVEAWARQGRYRALAEMAQAHGASAVLLAHHAQDQAETFLLQALRGAGVAGLSAMPMAAERGGLTWLRPWLHRSRSEVQSYIDHHGLTHIEDDSNADTRFARNRLRLDVWPSLQQAFPDATSSLSQSAAHLADAQACLAVWLEGLWPSLTDAKGQLSLAAWCQLPAPAQRMVLLAWARKVADQGLSRGWVGRLQQEWLASPRSGTRWPMGRGEVCLYRGWLLLRADVASLGSSQGLDARASWPCTIRRAGRYVLPAGLGVVLVKRVKQGGLPLSMLAQAVWLSRHGGEQFQMGPDRPARSLKKQFQQHGVPAWARSGPLLWAGEQLLFVPALGVDARAQAQPGEARVTLQWLPLAGEGAASSQKVI